MLVYIKLISETSSTRINHKNFSKIATPLAGRKLRPPRERKTFVSIIGGIGGGGVISNTPRDSWWAQLSINSNLWFWGFATPPPPNH